VSVRLGLFWWFGGKGEWKGEESWGSTKWGGGWGEELGLRVEGWGYIR